MTIDGSMLLIAPLHLRRTVDGQLEIEAQAANGLKKWAQHFSKVTLCAVIQPESQKEHFSSAAWLPIKSLTLNNTIECIPLPWSYHPFDYFRDLSAVKSTLKPLIILSPLPKASRNVF